jgi:intergrase/recombinase
MLNGNLRELDSFSKSKKNNVLKALIALSKYLGVYEQFKARKASYGIKWENQNSLQAFLRIKNTKPGLKERLKACVGNLDNTYATFIKFKALSGLRKSEAINAFNLIIELYKEGNLSKYYNSELESLEHFRYENTFIRGSKNVFFSFIPKQFIEQIVVCNPISESTLKRRLKKYGMGLRLNELRDYYATYMVHHEVIREEVDLLQGRIGKSIFVRHYFSPAINDLRDRALKAVKKLNLNLFS